MLPHNEKISIENLKVQRFVKILHPFKNTNTPINLISTKDKFKDFLSSLKKYGNLKKSNLNHGIDLSKNLHDLKENLINPITHAKLKSQVGFIYFKKTKRNICISVCDSFNHVKAVLSIGHLRVNKIKLKVKARKAAYNLKKLSYILGSLVYKAGFRQLYLKFKNDFPKKESQIFYNIFKSNKKFKIIIISRFVAKPHNGCRRPKMRRK